MKAEDKAPPLSLKKRLFFTLIVTAVVGVLALSATELIVRRTSRRYPTPAALRDRTLEYAPALFARHVFPRKELRANNEDENNPVEYYINGKGYRGRDFSAAKPAGAIRIIFYGGSATFDVNLPEGRDWPHRVESILRENGYPQVEVINAGAPGHASWDSFGRLFSEGHLFSPDYVVSNNGWNDFRYFRSDEPLLREFQPLCQSSRNTDPRLNYRNRIDGLLCEHSQLYLRLRSRYYDWRLKLGPMGAKPGGDYSSEITETALRQYYLNQVMFVDAAREIGAVPVLMTEARLTAPNNTESEKARIAPYLDYVKLNREGLLKAYEGIEGTLRKISAEKNVELIDVSNELDGRDEYFTDVVHLTPAGSEELAQLTARRLMELLKGRERKDAGRQ
ncbi:MAG: GDSL-type esterase/lipase family protein [Acidobacteria bacterium]|nr:GDSL-type esterase/lipase family protein [Acidobacteriota bacterium]